MKVRNITALYRASPEFHTLEANSRRVYEAAFKYLEEIMDKDADTLSRPKVLDLRDRLAQQSAHKCRMGMWVLNNILSFGYDRGLCANNHAARVKGLPKSKPIPRWTDEECDLFEQTAPEYIRMAYLTALYTGQRRSDLIRMKWSQYDGTFIKVLQQKTKRVLSIPVHPLLKTALDQEKARQIEFFSTNRRSNPGFILLNKANGLWSLGYFTKAFSDHLKKIGITGRSVHGLRKTTAAKLAELGCSPHLIASITGHKSLSEIMLYTDEADQKRMAQEAIKVWVNELSDQ